MAVYYIIGTSNSGSTFGQSGYFYPLYLTATEANNASDNSPGTSHAHTFEEVPGVTFYMPADTNDATHASPIAPTGTYSGEFYLSYTNPIAESEVLDIGTGVLAGDTFDTWRKKTNDIGRDTLLNKATIAGIDTRFNRLMNHVGTEENIMLLNTAEIVTGAKTFNAQIKIPSAISESSSIQVGANGLLHVASNEFKFNQTIDLHTAGGSLKASELDIPTGKTKYGTVTYTWPTAAPVPGQILKAGTSNSLEWDTEAAVESSVTAFVVEDPNPIATILQWPTAAAPSKWLLCQGQSLNTYTYRELHAVISNTYGGTAFDAGTTDQVGATTEFNVPNFQGRVPIGLGTNTDANSLQASFNTLGGTTGTAGGNTINGNYKHLLTIDEMPAHSHEIGGADGNTDAQSASPIDVVNDDREQDLSTDSVGGDEAHNNVQPFLIINYIIKYEGSTIVEQNITSGDGLVINGSGGTVNLLNSVSNPGSTNTIALNVDTSDFQFSGGALQINPTSTRLINAYRPGEIIERLSGQCDGRTVSGTSGSYTLPTVSAIQGLTTTYEVIGGTEFTYTPPTGTKTVEIEFHALHAGDDTTHYTNRSIQTFYWEMDTGNNSFVKMNPQSGGMYQMNISQSSATMKFHKIVFDIDSTLESDDINNAKLRSWTQPRTFRLLGRDHDATHSGSMFRFMYPDFPTGTGFTTHPAIPKLTITAIA